MRGTSGAIDHVQISEDVDVTFTTINESVPRGLCGSGVIDLVAEMYLSGVMERTGRIRRELGHPRIKVIDGEACFVVATAEESGGGRPVMISQNDITQIQYAKAAMYAGAEILMDRPPGGWSDIVTGRCVRQLCQPEQRPRDRAIPRGAIGAYRRHRKRRRVRGEDFLGQ